MFFIKVASELGIEEMLLLMLRLKKNSANKFFQISSELN